MHAKLKLILIFLCLSFGLFSQSGFTTLGGANFGGYARAGTNLEGIESIYMNQAGLVGVKNIAFDISAERRFNLTELTNISFSGAKTFGFGTVGVLVSNFGFTDYNEQKFALAYARRLGKSVAIGGQFDMLRLNINQYGSTNKFTFEMGVQVKINAQFSVSSHIFSPGIVQITADDDLGNRFRIGLKYTPSPKVFLLAEMDKIIYRQAEYKIGISYQMAKEIQFRLGVNPTLESFSIGARFAIQNAYHISSSYAVNNTLGNTPAISFKYDN